METTSSLQEKTIFVVDDNTLNLKVVKDAIKGTYRVRTLPSAAKMFEMLEVITPDLILLDIEMPEMDGFEALAKLKSSPLTEDIPVIFLTGLQEENLEFKGFQMGVRDFIHKPFSAPVLLHRVKTHVDMATMLQSTTAELHKKMEHLETLKNALITALTEMVEGRDGETGDHLERTSIYIRILVKALISRGVYADELRRYDLDMLVSAARLHDIGKVYISDLILNKPGKLTDEEYVIMKEHSALGAKIIDGILTRTDAEFLRLAHVIAKTHHERWDGKGYPSGLAGLDIPLVGRIMSIVDVFDALRSERPYKKAFGMEKTMAILKENAGTQFDPAIVEVFVSIQDAFDLQESL